MDDVIVYLEKPGVSMSITTANNNKVATYRIKSKPRTFLYITSILWGNNNGKNCLVTKARNLLKDRNKLNKKCIIPVPLSILMDIKGFE